MNFMPQNHKNEFHPYCGPFQFPATKYWRNSELFKRDFLAFVKRFLRLIHHEPLAHYRRNGKKVRFFQEEIFFFAFLNLTRKIMMYCISEYKMISQTNIQGSNHWHGKLSEIKHLRKIWKDIYCAKFEFLIRSLSLHSSCFLQKT